MITASQLKAGAPTYGAMYEMYVIAAVVVGGTSLTGGQGRVLGTLIGAFVIAVIRNGMNLMDVEPYTQKVLARRGHFGRGLGGYGTQATRFESCGKDPMTQLPDNPIEILRRDAAVALLLSRTEPDKQNGAERDAAQELARALGYTPVVVEIAAAHCAHEKMPLAEYLGLWNDSAPPPAEDYALCLKRAVSLSLDALSAEWSIAANLFGLCAFVAPDNIPYELLTAGAFAVPNPESGEPIPSALAERRFKTIRHTLRGFALIAENEAEQTFSLVPDVQAASRELMEPETRLGLLERAVEMGANAFPEITEANAQQILRLLPHLLFLAEWIDAAHLTSPAARFLLNQTASYLVIQKEYDAARALYERALHILQESEEPAHPDTLLCLYNLAALYRDMGDLDAAEPILLRALHLVETAYGNRHPEVAFSLNTLANLYFQQDRVADAARSLRRALRILEKHFGVDATVAVAMREVLAALKADDAPAVQPRIVSHDEDTEVWVSD